MDSDRQKTLLLVEDESIVALDQTRLLKRAGYKVETASCGERAVAIATQRPDISLVLMDIDLGAGIDGTEAAEKILERREVPIVFLTGHSEQEMVEKVKGITRYGYVIKNTGEFVLREAITMAFELFEAHTQLSRRNTFIETILDNLPIGLAVNFIDEGRAVYMNRKFTEIYGWPREEMRDIPRFYELVYPDPEYRARIQDEVQKDIASGDPDRMRWDNVRITRQDGSHALIFAQNIPLIEQNFMISTVQDVTDRALHEEVHKLIVERMNTGFALVRGDGSLARTNPALAGMLGYRSEELAQSTLAEISAGEADAVRARLAEVQSSGSAEFSWRLRARDGTELDVELTMVVLPLSGELVAVLVNPL
jgi:PAS domain S-box-containing protein